MSLWPERLSLTYLASAAVRKRALVRAPIWLYEHRLGRLLGERFLMLEHIGRASGSVRTACLEVIDRPEPDSVIVVSGFGTTAHWFRNLRAHPQCHVTLGRTRYAATAEIITPDEVHVALDHYQDAHPRAWKQLRAILEEMHGGPIDELPAMRFRLGESTTA